MRRMRVRPSRAQSTVGFIMGFIFIFIGIGFVIPNVGPFGIIWVLFAIIITTVNAINAFGRKGISSYEVETDFFDGSSNKQSHDFAQKLRDLESLRSDGLITNEEYEQKRKEIINDKW